MTTATHQRTRPPVRCAIIGCGMIADEYARTLTTSDLVRVTACTDLDIDRATDFAARHDIPAVFPLTDLDPAQIDLAIVLTPPATHAPLAHRVIATRISVYVEKPLALSATEAHHLLDHARDAGVLLGAAPDTILAPPLQTARAAIHAGAIGPPVAATAALLSAGPERWHPNPEPFYALGPLYDMGPYYLTTLVHILGPIDHVSAALVTRQPRRTIRTGPRAGGTFISTAPTHVTAFLVTTGGVPITFTASFDAPATRTPHIEIHGHDGTLVLPDPNFHTGPVHLYRRDRNRWSELPQGRPQLGQVGRGIGVLSMAASLLGFTTRHATGDLAAHICAVMNAIYTIDVNG